MTCVAREISTSQLLSFFYLRGQIKSFVYIEILNTKYELHRRSFDASEHKGTTLNLSGGPSIR